MKTTQIKSELEQLIGVDRVITCKADERNKGKVFKLRHGYFYRYGNSSEKFAASVKQQLASNAELALAGLRFEIIDDCDCWNAWPKDSYFQVTIEIFQSINQ